MTVDVEDYFQVSAFENHINPADWDSIPCRVENNVDNILQLFVDSEVKATFFTLGWIAERYPAMVKRIAEQGHEVASHGYNHIRIIHQTRQEFREDIRRTKALLEGQTDTEVKGYRAASFSITKDNLWALDELEEAGHSYSSSIYPIHHDLYGIPDAPRFPFRQKQKGILEIPVTTTTFMGRNLPVGGGGYFRLVPYALYKKALSRVHITDKQPGIFYFHPWEMDPDQPRQNSASFMKRFRHYTNLSRMEARIRCLCSDFNWGRVDEIFLNREYPVISLVPDGQ